MAHRSRGPWVLLALLVGSQAACKEADPAPGAAASVAASGAAVSASVDYSPTGLKPCDLYFAAAQGCLSRLDEAARKNLEQEVTQYRRQIVQAKTEAARGVVGVGCEAAREALADEGCE